MKTNIIIGGKYSLCHKIASGDFSEVFCGINNENQEYCAIKLVFMKQEPIRLKYPQLKHEIEVYSKLGQEENNIIHGIPNIYYYGNEGEFNVAVMELLGSSLEDIFQDQNIDKKFSLKTIVQLGLQIVKSKD